MSWIFNITIDKKLSEDIDKMLIAQIIHKCYKLSWKFISLRIFSLENYSVLISLFLMTMVDDNSWWHLLLRTIIKYNFLWKCKCCWQLYQSVIINCYLYQLLSITPLFWMIPASRIKFYLVYLKSGTKTLKTILVKR